LSADDLLLIKGIGPKINETLNGQGIARFAQIAAWTPTDVDAFDDHLGQFKDRIGREEWIPQAKLLAAGNRAEWERLYGDVADTAKAAGAIALTAIGIPAAVGDPDSLLQIKGIGPKLNTLLIGLGITRFDQIAAWGAAEIDKVDDHLGTFKNRITRDNWIEQAGLLARGEIAAFEAKFGKLDSENV
jgi:predicted flap endonuclease-1-like 5' DNA nuclease